MPETRPPALPEVSDQRRWSELVPWYVVVPVAAVGLAAVVVASLVAVGTSDRWLEELCIEVAKAGVQVVAVGVLGGVLAAAWRAREADRASHEKGLESKRAAHEKAIEVERAAGDKVRDELMSIVELYNGVKAVRRRLRSEGLDLHARSRPDPLDDADMHITRRQLRAYRSQMRALTALQLGFESKARQFGQTNLLGEDAHVVVRRLGHIESFLNQLLKSAWEHRGWTIRVGSPLAAVSEPLQPLFRRHAFRENLSEPLREITDLINKHVFGEATEETREAFQAIVEKQARSEAEDEPIEQ